MFTPWSHAVALIYLQLTKTESLNGVCDAARFHASQWQELRGAVPPRRNTFSNANQQRDPAMMESLYWAMKDHLGGPCPEFVKIKSPSVLAQFRRRRSRCFFKELKQTCQLHDFVGYNENAVKWQIWTGILTFTMTPVG